MIAVLGSAPAVAISPGVNHKLEKGTYDLCHGCRMPVSEQDKQSDRYMEGITCPHCFDNQTPDQRRRFTERQKQIQLAKARNEPHIGARRRQHQLSE